MLVDSQARQDALKLESKLIKAPAGSGKTGLLTNYFLKLLGVVEHPREIMAMTFTNKAAAEMSDRIIESIARVKNGFTPSNDYEKENALLAKKALSNSQARGWNIESNVNMLQISTIDSFCKKVLVDKVSGKEGLLATRNIANDPYQIYKKAAKDTLALYSDAKYGLEIQKLAAHFGNKINKVEELLIEMLESREQWISVLFSDKEETRQALESKRELFLNIVLTDNFESIKDKEGELKHVIAQLSDETNQFLEFVENGFSCELTENYAILKLLKKLLVTAANKPKSRFTINDGVNPKMDKQTKAELVDDLQQLSISCLDDLIALDAMPMANFKDTEWTLLKSVFSVMPILLANLSLTFKEVGEVDFTEIALNAVRALDGESGESTSGAIHKSQSIKHILCDEFQDSNNTQLTMLRLLTDSWGQNDGNTLFLVGDAMQSLYGFRGANVNVFMQAENGVGNVAIKTYELTTNFRSSFGVVAWVNDVFSKAFPQENDLLLGASKYNKSSAVKVGNELVQPVEIHGFIGDEEGNEEAKFIIEQIKAIQEGEPTASIAVLGRTRATLKPIVEALNRVGDINASTVNINKIEKEPLCIIAIALARILIDDLDKLAWVTLLNSGLVGMSHKKIELLLNIDADPYLALNDYRVVDIINGKDYERFCYVMNAINAAIDDKKNKDFDLLLEGLWYKLHGPSLAEKELDIENVQSVFDIFDGMTSTEISLTWLERKLQRLYAKSTTNQNLKNTRDVEIMTIHNAKGLEFDYVFIPGMHKRGVSDTGKLFSWASIGDSEQLGVMACSESIGIKALDVDYHKFLGSLKKKRELKELSRVIYVAVTRAIKKAYLSGKVGVDSEGNPTQPDKGSMFSVVSCAYNESVQLHNINQVATGKISIQPMVKSIDANLSLNLPVRNTLAAYRGDNRVISAVNGITWQKPISKIEGVVIHKVIEQINKDGIDNWDEQRVDKHSRVILASLKQLSLESDSLINSVNNIKNEVKTLLKCEVFKSLCSKHKKDDIEMSMSVRKNRRIHTVLIDKGFVTEHGVAHIIDWKSAGATEGQSMDSFISSQLTMHREKLKLYCEAYKEVVGIGAVQSSLYFTKTNYLQECS